MSNKPFNFINDPAARQLLDIRNIEKRGAWAVHENRSAFSYINALAGLQFFFDRIRSLQANKVLDIGAGTSLGVSQLSRHEFADDISFQATALVRNEAIEKI